MFDAWKSTLCSKPTNKVKKVLCLAHTSDFCLQRLRFLSLVTDLCSPHTCDFFHSVVHENEYAPFDVASILSLCMISRAMKQSLIGASTREMVLHPRILAIFCFYSLVTKTNIKHARYLFLSQVTKVFCFASPQTCDFS